MTIAAKLQAIRDAKIAIKTSIAAKGVSMAGAALDGYAAKIDSISTGVDISDADAAVGDVVVDKTFYATSGGKKTGIMPDNGTVSNDISAVATEVTIAAGKHSGSGIVKISTTEQAKIIAGNIKKDITILGVTGTVESIPDPSLFKVQFFDWEGTLLKTEYVASGANATPPSTPTHNLLTFNHWNHPCTNITKDENIGAIYNTTDGKTYIFATFNAITGLQPTISFQKSTSDVLTITWGDGEISTSSSTGNITLTKPNVYGAAGSYTITVYCAGLHNLGYGGYSSTGLMGSTAGAYTNAPTKIHIGANTSKLNEEVFKNFRQLKYITLASNITGNAARDACNNNQCLIALMVPSGVTGNIEASFLSNCFNLKMVSLATGMTGNMAGGSSFAYNLNLTSIVLPSSLTGAFGPGHFTYCVSFEKLIIPDGLTGDVAGVNNCTKLKTLKWSNGMTGKIVQYANSSLNCLESLTLPSGLTGAIETSSLNSYPNLRNLVLPSGMTGTIGDSALRSYRSLKSLTIPIGITGLAANCLAENTAMEEYIFQSAVPPTMANTNALTGIPYLCKIYVPDANVNDYKTATNWVTYAKYIYPISSRP